MAVSQSVRHKMQVLGLSEAEAIALEEADRDIDRGQAMPFDLTSEQSKVAKQMTATGSRKATKRKPVERKIDTEKVQIIAETADFLRNLVENVQITNESKIIEFDFNGNHYKFDLIKTRK